MVGRELCPVIQTAPSYGVSVWVRARDIEALHAASLTEQMLCGVGVETVLRQRVLALYQCKPTARHDDVIIAAHRADGAVADLDIEGLWHLDGEADSAAMAAAFMCV